MCGKILDDIETTFYQDHRGRKSEGAPFSLKYEDQLKNLLRNGNEPNYLDTTKKLLAEMSSTKEILLDDLEKVVKRDLKLDTALEKSHGLK